MKKNKLTFLIATSFLALSAMVGCDSNEPSIESKAGVESNITTSELINPSSDGGNSQSSNGGNSNSSTSQGGGNTSQGGGGNTSQGGGNTSQGGGTSDKTDWTDAEKATMRGALHGLVLPFVNMEATVRTNNDGSSVKIESQQNMSGNFLASYAEKFTYEDGWNGGDVSSEFGVSNGNAFAYQKAITESGKKYYVSVMFMGIEQTAGSEQFNISKTGRFYLEASDPYEYEYPAAFIGQWLGQQFGTSIVPPAFDAEYYNLDSEGVLIGYSERNIEESYKSALLSSGNFTIDSARNDDGFLIARPTDGSYIMLFKYDSTNKIMILQVIENNGWSAGKISAFYRKYNQPVLEFPALNVDGASYRFVEDEGNANYAAIGNLSVVNAKYIISKTGLTAAPLANYASALRSAGYAVTVFDESSLYLMKAIADGVYYSASIDYSASPIGGGKPQIVMNFYATGLAMDGLLASWPATQLRTFFGNDITDVLPAFTGNNCGFKIAISGDVAVIDINVDAEVSATIKDSYAGLLSTNEYSPESNKYISKNNQLEVRLSDPQGYGLYDIFQIRVEKLHGPVATPWPASEIAQAMASNLPSVTDTIPEIDVSTADVCTVNDNLISEISIYIGGGDIPLNDIKTTFRNAGWIEDAYYDYDFSLKGGFVSPSRQLVAHIQQLSEGFEISIKGYSAQDYAVVGVNNVWDYNFSEIVFNNATDPEEVDKGYYQTQLKTTFSVVSGDKFKVTNGIEWYGIETVEEGVSTEDFAYDTDGNIVAVKAGEVNLYFKTMPDGSKKIYIAYKSSTPVLAPWPEQEILAFFGEGTFASIPEIKLADASYDVLGDHEEDGVKIIAIMVNVADAPTQMAAAIQELENQFSYTYDNEKEGYVSSNEGFPVYAFTANDNGSFVVSIAYFAPAAEPAFKVVGLGNDWDYEYGTEFEIVEHPGEGIAEQYTALFHVDRGEEFKITNGTLWFGDDELVDNAAFGTDGDKNIIAKASGEVALTFSILTGGEKQISIVFEADEEQPTTLNYKLIPDDDWDNLVAGEAVFYAWVWGGTHGEGEWIEIDVDRDNHCFYLNNIDANATGFKVVRMNPNPDGEIEVPSWDAKWNESPENLSFPTVGLKIHFDILP